MSDYILPIPNAIGSSSAATWGALKTEIGADFTAAKSNDDWLNAIAEREISQAIGPNGALLPGTTIPHLSGGGTAIFTLAANTVAAIPMTTTEHGGRAVIVETAAALTQGVSATGVHYVWLTRSATGVLSLTVTTVAGVVADSVYLGKANVTLPAAEYVIGTISQPIPGRTRRRWLPDVGRWETYNVVTTATISADCAVHFGDDFLGYKLNKYVTGENTSAPWHTKTAGTPTSVPALLDDTAGGVVQMALAAPNESERSILFGGDQLCFELTAGLVFEARACLHVVPTTGTEKAVALLGLGSADNVDPDAVASRLWFKLDGTADILWECDDGITPDEDNDTTIDAVADAWHVFRIDCTDPVAPRFYIDGVLRGTAAAAFAAGTTGLVQIFAGVEKTTVTTNTSVATLYVDDVNVWTD